MILFEWIADKFYDLLEFYDAQILPIAKPLGTALMAISLVGLMADTFLRSGKEDVSIAFLLIVGGLFYKLALMNEEAPKQQQPIL